MESAVLSSVSVNQVLILNLAAFSAPARNVTFNQLVLNFLVSTSEVICLLPKEGDLVLNSPFFPYDVLVSCPF